MMYLYEKLLMAAKSTRDKVAKYMFKLLWNRLESFEGKIFSKMSWCNLEYKTDNKGFCVNELNQFSGHLKGSMVATGFDCKKAIKEWKNVQCYVKQNSHKKLAVQVWKGIFKK